jgi:hypothetical protein
MPFLNHGLAVMPLRSLSIRIALLAALLAVAPCAYGQETDTTQLPEIAPREIEIRGERQIALPSLERQPLTGFASPPAVPTVPADHRPYVGSYRHPLDELPESLPIPETVSAPMQPTAEPALGFLEGGIGRYFSRFFEGRIKHSLSATERVFVHGNYTGIEADPNDDVAEASVRLKSNRESVQIEAGVHGAVQRYDLYGATPIVTDIPSAPEREGASAGGSVQLHSTGSVSVGAALRYEGAQYASTLDAGADELIFSQQQMELQGSVSTPLPYRPHLEATYRRSWLGGDPLDDTAFDLDAGGTVSFRPTASTSVEAGATVLAFATPAQPTAPTPGSVEATFIAPSLNAEWRFTDDARLYLRNQPRLGETSLDQLYATNPYARHAPSLRPTLETTNAEAGLTLSRGPVRVVAATGYRYAPTYRYFTLASQPQRDYSTLYRVGYDAARIFHGHGQIALQGIDGVQASLGLSVQDGNLTSVADSLDSDIPNFAPVTADAMVGVSFAGGDGFVEAVGHFESPRDASLGPQARRLDSYFSLDLEGSYALESDYEIVVRAQNLSVEAPTLWAGYPRPPAQVSVGLRLKW